MSADGLSFTALVMAGSRPAGDPLAIATGVRHKALAPIAGKPLFAHVLHALSASRCIGRIVICGIDRPTALQIGLVTEAEARRLDFVRGADTPAASAAQAIAELDLQAPILITTADHPLLTSQIVDDFCTRSCALNVDVSFGIADASAVSAAFPGVRRTNYRLRDGSFCGCNLYGLCTAAARTMPSVWVRVEPHRKRPWRMFTLLGPTVLARLLIGRLSLQHVKDLVARRTGLSLGAVEIADPAAGFDVDNLAQLSAADAYLRARRVV